MRTLAAVARRFACGLAALALASPCWAADEDLAAIQLRGTLRVLVLAEAGELPRSTPGF